MISKKFRVRVRHWHEDRYIVEWANYYIIPFYRPLLRFFSWDVPNKTHEYLHETGTYEETIRLASSIKSINDIYSWYREQKEVEDAYYKHRSRYMKATRPFKVKQIL
jgi:hypothetical protein